MQNLLLPSSNIHLSEGMAVHVQVAKVENGVTHAHGRPRREEHKSQEAGAVPLV